MDIEFDDVDGFDSLADDIEKWGNSLVRNIDAAMDALADEILDRLQQRTKKRTGETAAAWVVKPLGPGDFFITNTNEPVITFLTQGTAAHFVAPLGAEGQVFPGMQVSRIGARALHWIDETGEHFSMGHWVRGIVGEDYETEVMEEMNPIIEQMLDGSIEAADRSLEKGEEE